VALNHSVFYLEPRFRLKTGQPSHPGKSGFQTAYTRHQVKDLLVFVDFKTDSKSAGQSAEE